MGFQTVAGTKNFTPMGQGWEMSQAKVNKSTGLGKHGPPKVMGQRQVLSIDPRPRSGREDGSKGRSDTGLGAQ
jgi:hypothetical protein